MTLFSDERLPLVGESLRNQECPTFISSSTDLTEVITAKNLTGPSLQAIDLVQSHLAHCDIPIFPPSTLLSRLSTLPESNLESYLVRQCSPDELKRVVSDTIYQ